MLHHPFNFPLTRAEFISQNVKVQDLFSFKPVGLLHSCFPDPFGTPRQGRLATQSVATLEILKPYCDQGYTEGLSEFSHLWLIFVFHQNKNKKISGKVFAPRLAGQKIGVFAARSPHRPNPIGLTCAKIISVEKDRIELSGVDIIDQTPILDLKPYIPDYDSVPEATRGWLSEKPLIPLSVTFAPGIHETLALEGLDPDHYTALIRECLELDPRPLVYRDMPERGHTLGIYQWDVDFHFEGEGFYVDRLRPRAKPRSC